MRAAVLIASTALLLTGCSSGGGDPEPSAAPTVAVSDATATYAGVLDEVDRALTATGSRSGSPSGSDELSGFDTPAGQCRFVAAGIDYPEVFGEDRSWDEIRDAVATAVGPHGFELTEMLEIPGGYSGFDARDGNGATISVRSKSGTESEIDLSAPLVGTCPVSSPAP